MTGGLFSCWFPGVGALLDYLNGTTGIQSGVVCVEDDRTAKGEPSRKPVLILHLSKQSHYGQHISRGFPALEFSKGPLGVFRPVKQLTYEYNYYKQWATIDHPFNFGAVLEAASHPPDMTTARDAEGILLADFNNDGEIDVCHGPENAFAFIEHWGVNEHEHQGTPFCHAWYDDNYVARIAMRAYCSSEPWGLHDSPVKSRFVVMEGDATHDPYPHALEDPAQYPDQISLHAFYLANNGHWGKVQLAVDALLKKSGAKYNLVTKRFDYPDIHDFYHLCDMKMVFQRLLDAGYLKRNGKEESLVFQHIVALHGQIMTLQLKGKSGAFTSWKTGVKKGDGSLINTETTVLAMLALGAGSLWTFEPTEYPFAPSPGFIQFPDTLPHVLCARMYEFEKIGNGLIAQGPHVRIPTGSYSACFNIRVVKGAQQKNMPILTAHIFDGISTIAVCEYSFDDLINSRLDESWKQLRLPFKLDVVENVIELRLYWHGYCDLDFGSISISL
ncbi:hypothetical protein BDR26DRAFT_872232 [Obelidium mucronatum]|nr:hypothetical protein BDR26DRAFT_872232 [Obelidium mucronatum]